MGIGLVNCWFGLNMLLHRGQGRGEGGWLGKFLPGPDPKMAPYFDFLCILPIPK